MNASIGQSTEWKRLQQVLWSLVCKIVRFGNLKKCFIITFLALDSNAVPVAVQDHLCATQPAIIGGAVSRCLSKLSCSSTSSTFSSEREFIDLVGLCRRSRESFAVINDFIGEQLMCNEREKCSKWKETIFNFIELLSFELQQQMKMSDYRRLFPDRLRSYVLLLSETDNKLPKTSIVLIEYILLELRINMPQDFMILMGYFRNFNYLMGNTRKTS